MNSFDVRRNNIIHEEIPLAEEIALLRLNFVVLTALFLNGKAEIPRFAFIGHGPFPNPEVIEVGLLGTVAAQHVAVGIEAVVSDDVHIADAQGLDKDTHQIEDEILRPVAKELLGQDLGRFQAVLRALDGTDIHGRRTVSVVIEPEVKMVDHLALMIEVERQEPFFSLARIKDEPHFKGHRRVVRRPERIAFAPIDFTDDIIGKEGPQNREMML